MTFGVAAGILAFGALCSCGNSTDEKSKAPVTKNTTTGAPTGKQVETLPNYRFINIDTIGLQYNLAIDFNEQMIRMQNNLAEEEKKQTNSLQNRANALQTKMNAAQSQSDVDALKGEYESIQKQQVSAQQKLAQMGADMEKTIEANAKTMQDSLTSFLRDFALKHGYDAVLISSAAPYYNPALDVTAEVVEGLNARYNKVKK